MKALLITIIVVLVLVLLGWLTFSNTERETAIRIEKQEIKEDAGKVLEGGKDLVDDLRKPKGDEPDGKRPAVPAQQPE